MITEDWRECRQCGLLSMLPEMQPGLVADCPRCGHRLWQMRRVPFEFATACGLAALLFYILALIAPFLEITAYTRFQLARLETGPIELALQNFGLLALLVFAVTVIFPGVKLVIMLITLLGLNGGILPARWLKLLFRLYAPIAPWAMVDVYLLGFLVAYTRLAAMATVHLDTALYALIGLVVSMAAADATLDDEAVWRALDHLEHRTGGAPSATQATAGAAPIGCRRCNMVNMAVSGAHCRRCHADLQPRIANSVNRCWAFVAAASVLYAPANIYPVMLITKLAVTQPFTITGGIIELFDYGLWPLALLVFFASITIPLVKLVGLGYMLVKTQTAKTDHLIGRTKLFRLIDFIGRWSMIDVFMISILVALVRFQQLANVQADVGAACFAGVVVLTMFAVDSFDPRLMWDAQHQAVPAAQHHAAALRA